MRTANAPHELLPGGLYLESLSIGTERVGIRVASEASRSRCPLCGLVSSRVHSRYSRAVSDLPWHGISVTLEVVRARRFFCDEASCERRIFCERLPEKIAARARKTDRLEEALLAIALQLGGRAGARLAEELGILAARDTLLRRIKGAPLPEVGKVRVLGVDDFAFKKGSTYGTILVDLELHKVVDLLPERSQESLVGWFERHPGVEVEVATRDRSNIYREGDWPRARPARRTWPTAGTFCTTWRSRWKNICSRSGPFSAKRRRRRRRPKRRATTPSLPGPSCRTDRGTTTGRSRRRPKSVTNASSSSGGTSAACTWRGRISGTYAEGSA